MFRSHWWFYALPRVAMQAYLVLWLMNVWAMSQEIVGFEEYDVSVRRGPPTYQPFWYAWWHVQRELWREEEARQVLTPHGAITPPGVFDNELEALQVPAPCADHTSEDEPGLLQPSTRRCPPRVVIYRLGPRPEDVYYGFGQWGTWEWGP